jgi:DNA polymerase-3 subunit gamma/tau
MSQYLALYRKYRPATFADLVGQEAVARTLASAIKQQRLAHAYLFCGPRGTGKTSVARILAKSVNCAEGPTDVACGVCSNCREITNGNNLDVIEIDAASNNGVDNIRDLQDRVALAPVSGRYKVYIIDEVHMLSQGAFNALLKTLEEPPPNVLFILATTDPHKVLATIISRCQRFDFGRIALGPLVGRLRFVADAEGLVVDDAGLEAIARRANGGLRDALSLLDQIAAMANGQPVSTAEVAASLGLLSGDSVCALGRALLEADVARALGQAYDILAAGYDHGIVLRELMAHFRNLMLLQLAPERAEALDVPTAQLTELRAQAAQANAAELPWMLEVLNETEGTVRRSPQQAIWLELGLIKVATRPSIPSFTALVERVERLEAALAGGAPLPAARPHSAPAARSTPVPPSAPRAPEPVQQAPAPLPPSAPTPAPVAEPNGPTQSVAPTAPPAPAAPAAATPPYQPSAPAEPSKLSDTGRAMPPAGPTFRPAGPARPATPAPDTAAEPAMPAMPAGDGSLRPLPPAAWDRVREQVRLRSVPTAALLDQQAAIDRWEDGGAVVIRIGKAFKDTFEKQAARKKALTEAVVVVFGQGAYPRLEVGDPKAPPAPTKPRAAAPAPAPAYEPPSYTPAPAAAVTISATPAAGPAPVAPAFADPALDDVPLADAPPDWLDELEDSQPDPTPGAAAAAPAPSRPVGRPMPTPPSASEPARRPGRAAEAPPAGAPGATPMSDDPALRLAVELFNGRVVANAEDG